MWVIVALQKVVEYWDLCDHLGLVVSLLTLWREGSEPVIGGFVPFCGDALDFVPGVVTDGVDVGNGLLLDECPMDGWVERSGALTVLVVLSGPV